MLARIRCRICIKLLQYSRSAKKESKDQKYRHKEVKSEYELFITGKNKISIAIYLMYTRNIYILSI